MASESRSQKVAFLKVKTSSAFCDWDLVLTFDGQGGLEVIRKPYFLSITTLGFSFTVMAKLWEMQVLK